MRDPFRDFLSRFMPWYDPDEADRHDERTEAIRRRSIRARKRSERIADLGWDERLRLARIDAGLPGRRR